MHIHIRIIEIILQSIQYRNKELLLELIKAELISSSSYLTQLAMRVNPKKYHTIHKLFSRVRFDYVAIQIEIIVMILRVFEIDKISVSIDDSIVYRSRKKKVPNGHKQFDHANKANRSSYVFGQKWLAFGLIIEIVKAVWVVFDDSQSMRLLVSTNENLSGEEIIKRYAKRWDIESMFNELKNHFSFKDIMMHTQKSYYQFLYFYDYKTLIYSV